MKSHSRYFIILGILIVACTKIDDKSLSVPNLPLQNSDLIIDISTTRSAGNILSKFWKTSVSTLYKGLWDNYPFLR